jgi:hypothetical protein
MDDNFQKEKLSYGKLEPIAKQFKENLGGYLARES